LRYVFEQFLMSLYFEELDAQDKKIYLTAVNETLTKALAIIRDRQSALDPNNDHAQLIVCEYLFNEINSAIGYEHDELS